MGVKEQGVHTAPMALCAVWLAALGAARGVHA